MMRRHHAVPVLQAAQDSAPMAQLMGLLRESNERLAAIQPLVPAALRAQLRGGPVDDETWCVLIKGNAAAAKLRQLVPAWQAHLEALGWPRKTIRLKVQAG